MDRSPATSEHFTAGSWSSTRNATFVNCVWRSGQRRTAAIKRSWWVATDTRVPPTV